MGLVTWDGVVETMTINPCMGFQPSRGALITSGKELDNQWGVKACGVLRLVG